MELRNKAEMYNQSTYLEFYSKSDGCYMPEEHCWQSEKTLPRLAWAINVIGREKFKSVIDLGCKDGYLPLSLDKYGVEAKGIDLSKDAIDLARERAKKLNLKVEFQTTSIEDYVDDKMYDCSCLLEVLDRVISPEVILKKCSTFSRNLLITVPDRYGRFGFDDNRNSERLRIYNETEIKKLMKKFGTIKEFSIVDAAYMIWLEFKK